MIDIKGFSKAELLAKLYNHSKPQGMGILHFDPKDMTLEEAQSIIDSMPADCLYFDYLKGRVMKVNLSEDTLNPWLYDRDNGEGAAETAILS